MRRVVLGCTLAVLALTGCNPGGVVVDAGPCVLSTQCPAGQLCREGACVAAPVDAGQPDAGPPDAGQPDAGPPDAGAPDAGPGDAGRPDAGPLVCATGTADCDSNPADCETNINTDPMNCGRCARKCGGTAICTSPGLCAPTLIMDPDVSSNYCSAVFTADRLFSITCWGNNDLSEVRTAPLEPGSDVRGTSIVAYNNLSVVAMRGLLIDGDSVLFGIEGNPSNVFKYAVNLTGVVGIAFTTDAGTRFDGLTLVGDTFYWVDNTTTGAGQVAPSTIKMRRKTDTADTTLVTGLGVAGQLIVTDDRLLWTEARTSLATPGVYVAPRTGTGGNLSLVRQVAGTQPGVYLIREGAYVYWTEKAPAPNGKLRRFEFANDAGVAEDVVVNLNSPEGLVSDGTYLYFKQADSLYRVVLSGQQPPERLSPVVAANDAQATQLYHVDSKYVYFVAGPGFGDSKIYRVAK